jgi:hypothetical protein
MIEKCQNFRRYINHTIANPYNETQVCKAKGVNIDCGGFSDYCKYPKLFKPYRDIPMQDITFPYNIPGLEELEERIRKENIGKGSE